MKQSITRVFITIVITALGAVSSGSAQGVKDGENKLFFNGVYLENLHLTLPWTLNLADLSKFGPPRISSKNQVVSELVWDSVKVLGGINASISCLIKKSDLIKKGLASPKFFLILFNSEKLEKIKNSFEMYSKQIGKKGSNKNDNYYYWVFDNCSVKLGRNNSYGAYIMVQNPIKFK